MKPPHGLPLDDERRVFIEGTRLFNEGQFFEAHDIWEEAWSRVQDRRRERFYRGIIQGAVTLELLRRGRADGVRKVFASCTKLLEGVPEVFMGVRMAEFLAALRRAIEPALAEPAARQVQIAPIRLFTIHLEYDPFVESRNGEGVDGRTSTDPP